MKNLHILQQEAVDEGSLQIRVSGKSTGQPIENARIKLSYTGNPQNVLEETRSDISGNTDAIEIDTPPLEYSMEPSGNQPYSEVTVQVEAEGYKPFTVSGVEVLPNEKSLQNIEMEQIDEAGRGVDDVVIGPHTLYGDYPPKIPEEEVKSVTDSGEIVLSRVVVPEYVVVHDGTPGDSTANNYYVRYKDYIKNVASSEIYATWPDATIRANVLAIMSFTLNRVYTEW